MSGPNQLHVPRQQRFQFLRRIRLGNMREQVVALAFAHWVVSANNHARRLWKHFHNRRNPMFCWTELDAEHLGIIQSLITTCKLHSLNPYTYLVDVLQRISQHPASEVVTCPQSLNHSLLSNVG